MRPFVERISDCNEECMKYYAVCAAIGALGGAVGMPFLFLAAGGSTLMPAASICTGFMGGGFAGAGCGLFSYACCGSEARANRAENRRQNNDAPSYQRMS